MSDDTRPDAFIQWKGTDACLDLYCTCGGQFHFDGYFAYELTCGRCGQTYELPNTFRLNPVEPSRRMKLVFDEQEVIGPGEFEILWPHPEFTGAEPGELIEVYDEVEHCARSAYVTFLGAAPKGNGTMALLLRNTGHGPGGQVMPSSGGE